MEREPDDDSDIRALIVTATSFSNGVSPAGFRAQPRFAPTLTEGAGDSRVRRKSLDPIGLSDEPLKRDVPSVVEAETRRSIIRPFASRTSIPPPPAGRPSGRTTETISVADSTYRQLEVDAFNVLIC